MPESERIRLRPADRNRPIGKGRSHAPFPARHSGL